MLLSKVMQNRIIRKIGFFVFSLFIIWHVIAISIVGPYSDSQINSALRIPYASYLQAIKQGGPWSFYAPAFEGSIMRYETVYLDGKTEEYPLTHMRSKLSNAYFRYTNFFVYLLYDHAYSKKRNYVISVAHYLCSQHKVGKIKAINFILLNQQTFTHEDFNNGKRPLDDEFIKRYVIGPYSCN